MRPNYLIPFASTTIVMLILGIIGSAFIFSGELIKVLKESSDIAVELESEVKEAQIEELIATLAADPRTIDASVRHLPPEEAFEILGLDFSGTDWWGEEEVPFRDMLVFNLKAPFFEPVQLSELKKQLNRKYESIREVHYQDRLVLDFHSNLEYLAWWFAAFGLLFLLLSVILIYNTTKLALYADRREIETMELVGASKGFIRKPYLIKSFILGLISGVVALLVIGIILYFALDHRLLLQNDNYFVHILTVAVSLPLAGGVFCLLCTWLTLNQYLKFS